MISKLIPISFLFTVFIFHLSVAQDLEIVQETDTFIEYEIINDQLAVAPPYELTAPVINGIPAFSITGQDIATSDRILTSQNATAWALSSTDKPVIETSYQGMLRNQEVASLKINVARYSEEETLITTNLRFRIQKRPQTLRTAFSKFKAVEDSPLSSGNWFKIPIKNRGIYRLTPAYLENLGIDLATVNPLRIQLWGTNGYVLPERNTASRPEFAQIPIIVEGESDGSFDGNDQIIFFGNSPHRVFRTPTGFDHAIHPYSDSTFVFLTIGNEDGLRVPTATISGNATETINSHRAFYWKEEELTKSESKQKTGRYWLGQKIPATAQNQFVTILEDTISGLDTSSPLLLSGKIYARAESNPQFQLAVNGEVIRQFYIARISDGYNSHEGPSAKDYDFEDLEINSIDSDGIITVELLMSNADNNAEAFVDYLQITANRDLRAENGQLDYFAPIGGSADQIATYSMSGFSSQPYVFDVSDPVNPVRITTTTSGQNYTFNYHTDSDTRIFADADLSTPRAGRAIENQNLHGIGSYPDYIIVTHDNFISYANELAEYRAQDDLTPLVVTQEQILNEFSGGVTDPSAIRDFLKHLWDFALENGQPLPKYLLLFGDTTYDTKNVVSNSFTNFVLTYESDQSVHRTNSYGTDDYFGHLDDGEGLFSSADRVDLGIGRISAQTRSEARIMLDKIYRYENPANNGDWQNLFTFAGDDDFPERIENRDLHVLNADGTVERMDVSQVGGRFKKIYLFSYPEEITGAGRQLPGATNDLISTINNGTLVFNYSGHGNMQTLADEELFLSDYIPQLTNHDKLTLIVTATCQFGRYDDIYAQSGAEKLVFAENGGGIASFTTTRVVYTNSSPSGLNFGLNIALSQNMLEKDEENKPRRFGDIFLQTKNTSVGRELNARKFILLGDPAVRIALPEKPISITEINGLSIANLDSNLTIQALDEVTLNGFVSNADGEPATDFNGSATITFFDAPRRVSIPQDLFWIESIGCYLNSGNENECTYEVETDVLFKGKAQVVNGAFQLKFIIPKDISFSEETGRIIAYAQSEGTTAGGSYAEVMYRGVNENAIDDGNGPELDVFLNDESFLNGSLANGSPTLIVELADSSGINTTGTGVGHEIIATIDTKPTQSYVLNNFYEGALNDFTKGRIEYPLDEIPQGSYTLKVRAWDVHNNPAEKSIYFEVAPEEDLIVNNIYNYPNPMNNYTSFTFEHNQQGNPLDVDIRIYTLSGKLVQHKKEQINTSSSYASISWNGRDRDNDRLGNGTYIYVLRVTTDTPEGRTSTEKIEKLVIIR